jgi:hypothetical protein
MGMLFENGSVAPRRSWKITHPTKRQLRFSVPRNAAVDDVKIYQKN